MNPFKYARMERKMRQDQIAVIVGCSRSHIAMLENDKTIPNGIVMLKLIYYFQLEPIKVLIYYNKIGLSNSLT